MSNIFGTVDATCSWSDLCAQVGEMLHLKGPAPAPVVRRALQDDLYAHYLIVTRDNPKLLSRFLADPRNRQYEEAEADAIGEESLPSSAKLVGRAARSFLRWGKSGFQQVDADIFERRWSACQACPNLIEAPDRMVYKAVAVVESDNRVCTACGCVARRKARLASERCPRSAPGDPSQTRWGEPVQTREAKA